MALPKAKRPSKPGFSVGIMIAKPKDKGDLDVPKPVDQEPDQDDQGGPSNNDSDDQSPGGGGTEECSPDPEAVGFRTEAETCRTCYYMQGDRCSHPIVSMPVRPGDSCAAHRFKESGGGDDQTSQNQQDQSQNQPPQQS